MGDGSSMPRENDGIVIRDDSSLSRLGETGPRCHEKMMASSYAMTPRYPGWVRRVSRYPSLCRLAETGPRCHEKMMVSSYAMTPRYPGWVRRVHDATRK